MNCKYFTYIEKWTEKRDGLLNRQPVSVGSGRLCGANATLCLKRGGLLIDGFTEIQNLI